MPAWLLVVLGSALGGLARWSAVTWVQERCGPGFPWGSQCGTLLVNVCGGLAIGACAPFAGRDPVKFGLMVGFLGGFTTFSAYSLQTFELLQAGRVGLAAAYAFGSMAACLVACWAGWMLARALSGAGS
jgi:CrcB protein